MNRQRGSALLLMLLAVGVMAAYFAVRAMNAGETERDRISSVALGQAKEALIGYASAYRYSQEIPSHANEVFGYLPCPDTNNDGISEGTCTTANVSVIGRFPWRTPSIGLPPLHDSSGECLWYAVSGVAKGSPKTPVLNWDTPGQFRLQNADGALLTGASPHEQPLAVLFASQNALAALGQSRLSSPGLISECPGNFTLNNYLEGTNVAAGANVVSTITLGTLSSRRAGTNNDQAVWINSKDVFDRIKIRNDFKADIDGVVSDLADYLNSVSVASLPATSTGDKGTTGLINDFVLAHPGWPAVKTAVRANWQDNILYSRPPALSVVNGAPDCAAVLLFSGERTQRTTLPVGSQIRAIPAQTGSAAVFGDPAMYLEGPNTIFPASGTYTANSHYDQASPSSDIARCIKGLPPGATQQSFAQNFSSFLAVGQGVLPNPATQAVTIRDAVGSSGGCFWFPDPVQLAGRTLRYYYDFRFSLPDSYALNTVGADRGNGFAMQLVGTDPGAAPNTCGSESAMGVLNSANPWGINSIVIETDVYRNAADFDPIENHSAILIGGHVDHSGMDDTMTTSCNGTAAGCRFAPSNTFEENPTIIPPQRTEIHTGCNSTCTSCNSSAHATPTNYLRVTTWLNCTNCNDVSADLDRAIHVPTMQRCVSPNAALNSVYFGLTGGFRSGASSQGVSFTNLILRSE